MATLSVNTGALATLERQLEALSPRDRKLLVGLVLFAVLLGTAGFWYLLHGLLEDKASRVRDAKDSFAAVVALEQEYREADARFVAQKDRLQEYGKQPVTAYIEELAQKHGLNESLTRVNQNASETIGDIVQTRYTVELKKAQQEPLYRFLYDLETSGFPARVEQASFKVVVVRKERQMDLNLDITVLSLAQEG
jgi:type II secretory pathway component PulM